MSKVLKIDGRMKVATLIKDFKDIFNATLRVKVGHRRADDNATLASIRANENAQASGEFAFPANMTAGVFQESMLNIYGLSVIVATQDDWVAVLPEITLEQAGKIKKGAVRADMEAILAAQRAADAVKEIENEGIVKVAGNKTLKSLQEEFAKKFKYLALCFIRTSERLQNVGVHGIDTSKTISAIATKTASKELSIDGHNMVKTIEEFFWNEMGIACQVGVCDYTGHHYYFPLGSFNDKNLTQANQWAKDAGCKQLSSSDVAGLSNGYIF